MKCPFCANDTREVYSNDFIGENQVIIYCYACKNFVEIASSHDIDEFGRECLEQLDQV